MDRFRVGVIGCGRISAVYKSAFSAMHNAERLIPSRARTCVTSVRRPVLFSKKMDNCFASIVISPLFISYNSFSIPDAGFSGFHPIRGTGRAEGELSDTAAEAGIIVQWYEVK